MAEFIIDRVHLKYKIDIQDQAFRHFPKTVYISFFDENDKIFEKIKYGFMDCKSIYEAIEKGEDINLNNAFVANFSLLEYRTERGLDDSVPISLKNFSAKKSFFECDLKTDFSYAKFEGDKTVLESSVFGHGGVDFNHADFGDGMVSFKKVRFGNGFKNFQFATFGTGDITFNAVQWGHGNVNFVSTHFGHGNVDFKSTEWGNGAVDFKFARFSDGDVSFEKSVFGKGKKDFKNLEFGGGKIDFRRVDFNDGDVSFDGVEFGDGKVSFRSSSFGVGFKSFEQTDFAKGEVQFDQVDFGSGRVSFYASKADRMSFTHCPLNAYMDFRFSKCNVLDLSNTVVRDIVDLMPTDEHVHVKEFNIAGMRILGRIFIDWRKNDVFHLIYIQKETNLFQKAEQFRLLKENFRNNGQYNDEDASYIEFKRCEAKAILEDGKKSKDWFKKGYSFLNYYFQKYVFDFIGRYATEPTRVLLNMGIVYIIYSFVFYFISEFLPNIGHIDTGLGNPNLHSINTAFYYSAITFFTIGYGDYFPNGVLKLVATFEGFSGVFLMSYFTVAFVRKILR